MPASCGKYKIQVSSGRSANYITAAMTPQLRHNPKPHAERSPTKKHLEHPGEGPDRFRAALVHRDRAVLTMFADSPPSSVPSS